MSPPKCHWVRSVLAAFLDGELSPPTAGAVRRHLEQCEACRKYARELEETWDALSTLPAPPVRSGFTERMMARIVEEKEIKALEARLRPNRRLRQILTTASGLAAGLVLGLALHSWTALTTEPASPVEREVSRNLAFLEDAEYLDTISVVEIMDRMAAETQTPEEGA